MVYIDGVPLNDGTGASVDLSSISLSDVDSIEIYKGSTPINFGPSSIGGAINIQTKRASDEKIHSDTSIGTGSFGTWKFATNLSQKPSKFDYLINGEYISSKNDFKFTNDNGTENNSFDDTVEKRNNSQFKQGSSLVILGYDIDDDRRIVLSNQYFQKGQHLPNWNNSYLVNTTFDTTRNMSSLKFINNKVLGYKMNSASRVDLTYKKELYNDQKGQIGLGSQKDRYRTNTYGIDQFLEWPLNGHIINSVIDIRHDDYKMEDLLNSISYPYSSRTTYVVSAEDEMMFLSSKLIIAPAVSFEAYSNNYQNKMNDTSYLNPKLGLRYSPVSPLTFRSNIARYIREPSFFELFGDRGFFTGNPDLRAEKGVNFDIGGDLTIGKTTIGAAYFASSVKDVISYVYNSQGIGKAMNTAEALIEGIEASIDSEFLRYFRLNINYTWQIPKNEDTITVFNGKYLPGRAIHTVSSKLEAKKGFASLYYELLYNSGLYYDGANLLKAPIKREHNLGITLSFKQVSLTGEVKNIGNQNYEDFNGYPQPGRSYWLTMRHELN